MSFGPAHGERQGLHKAVTTPHSGALTRALYAARRSAMEDGMFFILAGLVAVAGWVPGIVGFFKARRALRELEMRRRQSQAQSATPQRLEMLATPPPAPVPSV